MTDKATNLEHNSAPTNYTIECAKCPKRITIVLPFNAMKAIYTAAFAELGWHVHPSQCPDHNTFIED